MNHKDLKRLNRERYGAAAQNYVASPVHSKGMGLERIVELAQPHAEWRTLDVATGGGHTALAIAPHVAEVVATDFTPAMLTAAESFIREQGVQNITFQEADAEALPFGDASFDLVTCRVAAHHFPDVFAFMQQAARVLKPGGRLIVHDHVAPEDAKVAAYVNAYEKLRDPGHVRILPESEWRGTFLDVDLTIHHVEQFTIQHQVLRWAKRQRCSDETIERLQIMLLRAPDAVKEWMEPEYAGTDYATYTDHHIIIVGDRKT